MEAGKRRTLNRGAKKPTSMKNCNIWNGKMIYKDFVSHGNKKSCVNYYTIIIQHILAKSSTGNEIVFIRPFHNIFLSRNDQPPLISTGDLE